jgi:hypothetical protein
MDQSIAPNGQEKNNLNEKKNYVIFDMFYYNVKW